MRSTRKKTSQGTEGVLSAPNREISPLVPQDRFISPIRLPCPSLALIGINPNATMAPIRRNGDFSFLLRPEPRHDAPDAPSRVPSSAHAGRSSKLAFRIFEARGGSMDDTVVQIVVTPGQNSYRRVPTSVVCPNRCWTAARFAGTRAPTFNRNRPQN